MPNSRLRSHIRLLDKRGSGLYANSGTIPEDWSTKRAGSQRNDETEQREDSREHRSSGVGEGG